MESNVSPKIRIYCHNERYFLAVGEEYLDEILYGKLPENSDFEIIETADYQKVLAAWESFSPGATPWMIHPNIANEYRVMLRDKTLGRKTEEIEAPDDRRRNRFRIGRTELPRRRS